MTGAATVEEDPVCGGRAARRLWAEAGERERFLGCLRFGRGEPGERRQTLREDRGARPTTGGEAWRCEDADRGRDLDGREPRCRAGDSARTTPEVGRAGDRARSPEQVRTEGEESLEWERG